MNYLRKSLLFISLCSLRQFVIHVSLNYVFSGRSKNARLWIVWDISPSTVCFDVPWARNPEFEARISKPFLSRCFRNERSRPKLLRRRASWDNSGIGGALFLSFGFVRVPLRFVRARRGDARPSGRPGWGKRCGTNVILWKSHMVIEEPRKLQV